MVVDPFIEYTNLYGSSSNKNKPCNSSPVLCNMAAFDSVVGIDINGRIEHRVPLGIANNNVACGLWRVSMINSALVPVPVVRSMWGINSLLSLDVNGDVDQWGASLDGDRQRGCHGSEGDSREHKGDGGGLHCVGGFGSLFLFWFVGRMGSEMKSEDEDEDEDRWYNVRGRCFYTRERKHWNTMSKMRASAFFTRCSSSPAASVCSRSLHAMPMVRMDSTGGAAAATASTEQRCGGRQGEDGCMIRGYQ